MVCLLSLAWGSFLGALYYRRACLGTILSGRSACPKCGKTLQALDLIPVLSYLALRGRCRFCAAKISRDYVVIELGALALGLIVYSVEGATVAGALLFLSLSFIFLAALQDAKEREVDLFFFILGVGFAISWLFAKGGIGLESVLGLALAALAGAALPFLLYIVSREKWMGLGDSFFGGWAGIVCGIPAVFFSVFFAFLAGAIYGIILIARKRAGRKERLAFGPFLVAGAIAGLLVGDAVVGFYLKAIGL